MIFTPPISLTKQITEAEDLKQQQGTDKTAKAECEEKGWVWDEIAKTCTEPDTEKTFKEGEVITDEETGKPSGIVKNGKTFFLPRDEIQNIATKRQEELAPITGATTVKQRLQQEELQKTLQTIGKIDPITGQETGTDVGQAIASGFFNDPELIARDAAIGAWGGAKAGGALGTTVVPGIGTAIGGVAGGVIGGVAGAGFRIWSNIQGDIEQQQKGQIGADVVRYNQAVRNLRTLALLATTYPEHAEQLISDFNAQKTLMHQSWANVKKETDDNLEKYIEDGTVVLAKFDTALSDTGIVSIYEDRLNLALSKNIPMNDEDLLNALEDAEVELLE